MPLQGAAQFTVEQWDEAPYDGRDGHPKLSRASVLVKYAGAIDGTGVIEYLMTYLPDGSAEFLSQERVAATIGEQQGSFVSQGRGRFENGVARGTWSVVPGAGTGALDRLRGEGTTVAGPGAPATVTVDFRFD